MPTLAKRVRERWWLMVVVMLLAVFLTPNHSPAVNKYWTGLGIGPWWDFSGNWEPAGQPQTNDVAILNNDDSPEVYYFNLISPNPELAELRISNGSILYQGYLNLNHLLTAKTEHVGYEGGGMFIQSNGTNTAKDYLWLGYTATGNGTYELSGGSLSSGYEGIGISGVGLFKQTGGTNNCSGTISLGEISNSTSIGTYRLEGGNLLSSQVFIGQNAAANLFKQIGGTHTNSGNLYLAVFNSATNGTYELSGGSLSAPSQYVGTQGTGLFKHYAGTNTITASLVLGSSANSSGTYNLHGGSLSASQAEVGKSGSGTFTQWGGTHTVTNTLTLACNAGSSGTYNLNGGSLTAGSIQVNSGGAFNQAGGTVTGNLTNAGTYKYSPGAFGELGVFTSRLINYGTLDLQAYFTAGNGLANYAGLTIPTGRTIALNGQGLDNCGSLILDGGVLTGNGPLVNNTIMQGYGTISGTKGFTNNALFTHSGGNLTLSNTGTNNNFGTLALAGGKTLTLAAGVRLYNFGNLNLNGASLMGPGILNNNAGGVIFGTGLIANSFYNACGELQVSSGVVNVTYGFANRGLVSLSGPLANLAGGPVSNYGTVRGYGRVGNNLTNYGTVEPLGGNLTLGGIVSNKAGALLTIASGTNLLITQGLASNAGVINLNGGTFDNNNFALANTTTGQISGYGVLRTGGLTNSGTMTLSGGPSTVNGAVTNTATGRISLKYPAIFTGPVTNNGYFKVTGLGGLDQQYVFAGGFTGTFITDPATTLFSNLTLGPEHYLAGGPGDRFLIDNNLVNKSANLTQWDTREVALSFIQGSDRFHDFYLTGADLGAIKAGFLNNFAWGSLTLEKGQFLNLLDGNDIPGGALYVGDILGLAIDWQGRLITNISGHGLNIYYDPLDPDNAYLKGQTFAFLNGGHLAPAVIPVPGTVWLLLTGLAGVLGLRPIGLRSRRL